MRVILLLVAAAVLAGCAGRPLADDPERVVAAQRAEVADLDSWTLNARLGINLEHEAWQAGVRWRQAADDYELNLTGPLGQGAMQLRGDSEHVVMQVAGEAPVHADNPDALLEAELGWRLPLRALTWWVRGVPDPAAPVEGVMVDAAGHLVGFEQAGWLVEPDRYETVEAGAVLPHRLEVTRGDDYRFRLVISSWSLPAATPVGARQGPEG